MSLETGKHITKYIGETYCTIIESGIDKGRVDFLKDLLEFNSLEVLVTEDKRKNEEDPVTYTLGVTDLVFNPIIAVYERELLTRDGHKITPAYWKQESDNNKPQYWEH